MAEVVQTVLGHVQPNELGRTLTHEHLHIDYRKFLVEAPSPGLLSHLDGDIQLKNVGFIQRYPYSNLGNVSLFGNEVREAVVDDLRLFRKFGGGTIVENTSHGLRRDTEFLRSLSEETGVHIVAGTGFYLGSVQSDSVINYSVEQLCNLIRADLTVGSMEHPDVKCGVIGEVASDYPITQFEAKAIQATALVQEELKCPVTFHPGRDGRAPFEIMRLYAEAGGDAAKAVMSHLDRTLSPQESLEFAAEHKCYLQLDLFGTEVLVYQLGPKIQMPSDYQRIERVQKFIEEGYLDRVLMSHDIHTKHRLAYYGGHGYFHILTNVIPKMKSLGLQDTVMDQITMANPSRWLSWKPQ